VSETLSTACLDAGFHCSLWAHRRGAEMCAEKASATGVAIVSVRNAGVSGALSVAAGSLHPTSPAPPLWPTPSPSQPSTR
jgi:LDH2 family malate/lactate/ureidoglycolate dehydrogenase